MKSKNTYISIAIVCVILTMAITVQVRTMKKEESSVSVKLANSELKDNLLKWKEKSEKAEEDLEKSDSWFNRYGMTAALIGRNFPIIRTLISLPIGIMRLSFWKFLVYTTLGSIPWTFVFVYLGYALGNNWVVINQYIGKLKMPIQILLIMMVVIYFYRKLKAKKDVKVIGK